jgi:hypothetical protein
VSNLLTGNNDLKIDSLFKETFSNIEPITETKSEISSLGIQDGITGIEASNIEIDYYPLKHKVSPGGCHGLPAAR